uniref:Uncharacterized protein n=1 Tax=Anguilla anguilla TaxID=7936 RepID=A0A0E9TB43_ANGAN
MSRFKQQPWIGLDWIRTTVQHHFFLVECVMLSLT